MFDNEEHDCCEAVLPAHLATALKQRFGRERSCFFPTPDHGLKSTTAGWVLFYKQDPNQSNWVVMWAVNQRKRALLDGERQKYIYILVVVGGVQAVLRADKITGPWLSHTGSRTAHALTCAHSLKCIHQHSPLIGTMGGLNVTKRIFE